MQLQNVGLGVLAVPVGTQAGGLKGSGRSGKPHGGKKAFFFLKGRYSLGKGGGSKK